MKYLVAIVAVLVVVGGGYYLLDEKLSSQESKEASTQEFTFENPKKSAHYESNTPHHASVLALVPINVVIDFNFDLAKPSEIKIMKEGVDYGVGETVIDSNKLAMRREMRADAPNGQYKVEYNACWPDGSCHDGYFEFAIDPAIASGYEDLTGQEEVTVRMSEIMFKPRNIKVSPGTRIIWVNDEEAEHYVNTETHPAHTYYPMQNSKVLKKGDVFSASFDRAGIYPYHCSAHADVMMGNILVQ